MESIFSNRVELVIKAAMTDGVITDKEREAIKQMAMQDGIPADVVDVMLDARLEEAKKQHQKKQHRCPNCGAEIDAFKATCPYCGTDLKGHTTVLSVQELNQRLQEIDKRGLSEDEAQSARRSLISTFPVPNSREDLLEFLTLSAANSKKTGGVTRSPFMRYLLAFLAMIASIFAARFIGRSIFGRRSGLLGDVATDVMGSSGGAYALAKGNKQVTEHNQLADVWKAKFQQCMTKARLVLTDPRDIATLDDLDRQMGKKHKK